MSTSGRKELLETIEEQDKRIVKYRDKLRDVIAAYKSLAAEKEAVESSLKILTENAIASETSDEKDLISVSANDNKISTLTKTLITLTEEKTKTEARYHADRRKLLQQNEELTSQLAEVDSKWTHRYSSVQRELDDVIGKLRHEQTERTQEQNDHGHMLRELQGQIETERNQRENLEFRFAQLESLYDQKYVLIESVSDLQSSESYRHVAETTEQRSLVLETQIQDMTLLLGFYSKRNSENESLIDALKDEVAQLKIENDMLAKMEQGTNKTTNWESGWDDCSLSSAVQLAAMDSKSSVRMEGPYPSDADLVESDSVAEDPHEKCKLQCDELRQRVDALQEELTLTRNKPFRTDYDETTEQLNRQVRALEKEFMDARIEWKKEKSVADAGWQDRVRELNEMCKKQRERTQQLVYDKDEEIKLLKAQVRRSHYNFSHSKPSSDDEVFDRRHSFHSDVESQEEANQQLTVLPYDIPPANKNDLRFLHFSTELARKDVELSSTRQTILKQEAELRALKRNLSELKTDLKGFCLKVERLEQSQSPNQMNFEYLKNVVLKYMLCTDKSSRTPMFNAIAAVLKFTPDEMAVLHRQLR